VKEIPATFFTQKKYLFQVLANPTKTLSNRDPKGNKKKHGSHYAITKPDEIREWFLRKAEQSGFRTLDVPQLDIGKPIFYKLHKKEHEGTIIGVEFKGGLEVIKKENFLKVVREGIGRARGFGFGMLVLKPMA